MPLEGAPRGCAIHATAIAVNGRAILIRGASKSGKSLLAAGLLAASSETWRVELVGDDRVMLMVAGDGEVRARPHPRIAGFIERRGLGLVATSFVAEARVAGVVHLKDATTNLPCLANFPALRIVDVDARHRCNRVWAWWSRISSEADRSHVVDKVALTPTTCAKDYT